VNPRLARVSAQHVIEYGDKVRQRFARACAASDHKMLAAQGAVDALTLVLVERDGAVSVAEYVQALRVQPATLDERLDRLTLGVGGVHLHECLRPEDALPEEGLLYLGADGRVGDVQKAAHIVAVAFEDGIPHREDIHGALHKGARRSRL